MDLLDQIRLSQFLACDQTDAALQKAFRLEIGEVVAVASNDELLRAYQGTDGEPGNPEADALLAEIDRRGLDV